MQEKSHIYIPIILLMLFANGLYAQPRDINQSLSQPPDQLFYNSLSKVYNTNMPEMTHYGDSLNVTRVGRLVSGLCTSVAVKGNIAFFNNGANLKIVDFSDPAKPLELSTILLPDEISAVTVNGDIAYVGVYNKGLYLIEISDPRTPHRVAYIDVYESVDNIAINDNYIYLAAGSDGLRVIDVSVPSQPREVGFFAPYGAAADVVVRDNYAYVADYDGLRVIDISNPQEPLETGFIDTRGDAFGIELYGNYAYVATEYGLCVFDISNPASPRESGFFSSNNHRTFSDIEINDGNAFLAEAGQLIAIDITDPSNPREVGFIDAGDYNTNLSVFNNYAYLADGFAGLRVIDISDPSSMNEVAFEDTDRSYDDFAINGNYAYVEAYYTGLRVIDISESNAPKKMGSLKIEGGIDDIAISGEYAYVASFIETDNRNKDAVLRIINISDPIAPREVMLLNSDFGNGIRDIFISGTYAYIACSGSWTVSSTLQIIDLSDPLDPIVVGTTELQSNARALVIRENHAYVATESGLQAIDISDPSAPQKVGFINIDGEVQFVDVSDGYAYVSTSGVNTGLHVIDISDPSNLQYVGFFNAQNSSTAYNVAISGEFAYLGVWWGFNGLLVIDISDPTKPREVGFFEVSGNSIAVSDGYTYMTAYDGFHIFKFLGESFDVKPHVMDHSLYEEFYVDIQVSVCNLSSLAFTLNFPADQLEALSAKTGDFLGTDVEFSHNIDNTTGNIRINLNNNSDESGSSGTGVVARIKMIEKPSVSDGETINLSLMDITANDPSGNAITLSTQDVSYLTPNSASVSNNKRQSPDQFTLYPNYPNPFNPTTTIRYDVPEQGKVEIQLYDIRGRLVKTLVNKEHFQGAYSVVWNGRDERGIDVAAGVYLCRMVAGKIIRYQKLILAK